jgi:transcriptional regulator with XRE-family HTH domain
MAPRQQLAEFLRARRQRLKPEDVGLPVGDRRRVPGLRREEVASLAGLSADYYVRLEQGRDHRPSDQVLESLATALRLDADATGHLFALAHPGPQMARALAPTEEHVDPTLQELLDGWTMTPTLVHGRRLDVLASNPVARVLSPLSEPGRNMLRAVFLEYDVRAGYENLDKVLETTVAYFRAAAGSDVGDPWFASLVAELSSESAEFRRLWARHDVRMALDGQIGYRHRIVGSMSLRYQTAAVGNSGQRLFMVHADPGTPDAESLALLAALADETEPARAWPGAGPAMPRMAADR